MVSRRVTRFENGGLEKKRKPFKNDEKCFLFHLESYFRSQDI